MTVLDQTPAGGSSTDLAKAATSKSSEARKQLSSPWASLAAVVIAVLWTLPTFGLFLSSFRPEREVKRTVGGPSSPTRTSPSTTTTRCCSRATSRWPTTSSNSILITIPAVIIPIVLATISAYAFAWMKFPYKDTLFVAIFALQIVPLQVALLPLLEIFVGSGLNNTFWTVWIAHSIFALPLAIYLLHNSMRDIPAELVEAARVDGAGHVLIFTRIMLPLMRRPSRRSACSSSCGCGTTCWWRWCSPAAPRTSRR
jgi:alpha-glucoside transport system permease protein